MASRTSALATLRALLRDTRGGAAIEYGLLAALIGIGMMTAAGELGGQLADTFRVVETAMSRR